MSEDNKFKPEIAELPSILAGGRVEIEEGLDYFTHADSLPINERLYLLFNKINEVFVAMSYESVSMEDMPLGFQTSLLKLFMVASAFREDVAFSAQHSMDEHCGCGEAAHQNFDPEMAKEAAGVLDAIMAKTSFVNRSIEKPSLTHPTMGKRNGGRKRPSNSDPVEEIMRQVVEGISERTGANVAVVDMTDRSDPRLVAKSESEGRRVKPRKNAEENPADSFGEMVDEDGNVQILVNGKPIDA